MIDMKSSILRTYNFEVERVGTFSSKCRTKIEIISFDEI